MTADQRDRLARAAMTEAWDLRAQGRDDEAAEARARAAAIRSGVMSVDDERPPSFRDPAAEYADARAGGAQALERYRHYLRENAAAWARQHAADPDLQTSAAVWAELAALPL